MFEENAEGVVRRIPPEGNTRLELPAGQTARRFSQTLEDGSLLFGKRGTNRGANVLYLLIPLLLRGCLGFHCGLLVVRRGSRRFAPPAAVCPSGHTVKR